ncbi:MAG: hypothetical protein IJ622_07710 [Bacteroidales bacterium]|nr:hypothetical protein [Bacteroidales bacterium]
MKKLFLTLALAFVGIMSANAQLWIGGGLGASVQKNHTSFSIAPEVGYAINNKWQIALGASYNFNQVKGTDLLGNEITNTTNALALQPYVRYVAGTIGKKFSLFVDLCGDFGLLDDARDYAVTLQPGIAWQATEKFTAAFRFCKVGYDHNFYGTDGFLLDGDLAAPQIRLYYNF